MQLSVVPQLRYSGNEQAISDISGILPDLLIGDGVTGYEPQNTGKNAGLT